MRCGSWVAITKNAIYRSWKSWAEDLNKKNGNIEISTEIKTPLGIVNKEVVLFLFVIVKLLIDCLDKDLMAIKSNYESSSNLLHHPYDQTWIKGYLFILINR